MLEVEERELLREMEEGKETVLERQAKMREKAKILRERRESDRQQVVAEKLDQLFRLGAHSVSEVFGHIHLFFPM